jgi:hypothetical protein
MSSTVFLYPAMYLTWLLLHLQKQCKISYFLPCFFNNKMTSPLDRQGLNIAPCTAKSEGDKYL